VAWLERSKHVPWSELAITTTALFNNETDKKEYGFFQARPDRRAGAPD
jgi:hypothetical protein